MPRRKNLKENEQQDSAQTQPEPTNAATEPAPKKRGLRLFGRAKAKTPDPVAIEVREEEIVTVAETISEAPPVEELGEKPKRSRRPAKKFIEEPEAVALPAAPEPVEAKKEGSKRPRSGRGRAVKETSYEDLGDDLPMPAWRPKKNLPEQATARTERPEPRQQEQGRRERGRRKQEPEPRQNRRQTREVPPLPAPVVVAPEPLPERPVRPVIHIPEDAPQVVLRDGIPTLVRGHRVYPPIAFFGNAGDEKRSTTVIDEMRMAGEAGVHIHSCLVEFEVDPRNVEGSVAFAAYMLNKSVEADPEAQVLFRIVFIAPAGWTENYPDAKYLTADGALAEPSVSDDKFWDVAKDCLRQFVRMLGMLDKKEHILGVHLERGEWFYGPGWGYDTSNAAKHKFRDWNRMRYRNDVVALRAAWFDGGVSFNTASIPEWQGGAGNRPKFIRSNRKERRWVDYHLFLSDATVERIGDLAYAAKEESGGYFLVGASYGYTFEWSHPASGHLSLGKLLRTPEIDFIAGPPSYNSRQPGGVAPFPGPIDSFALNGKLYISEEDFKTSIGGKEEPDDFNPVVKTPQALESVHWRGVGSALAHASGVCWMDLWGNGWLKTPGIWDRAKVVRECLINRMASPLQDPDVAIFIDERALAYLVDEEAFALLVQNVRESVLRSGLNAAFYLLSDLQHREKFPESKLYVFLNAWDIRPELRAAIKARLQRDNKVLFWIFAAGLFDSGRESLERAREVTGIALKPQPFHSRPGTTILNRRHPLTEAFPEKGIGGAARMEPSYFAIPEEAVVLGEYTQTGLPSFVVREFNHDRDPKEHWTSVFLGEPIVTPALLRALAHMAGVHVWNYQDDVVHVRPPFLAVHCTGPGPRTLTMPNKWVAYDLLDGKWTSADSSSIRIQASDGATYLFLAGTKDEVENVLSKSDDDLLHLENLPQRPDNTVRFDAATFDVPIMKLDEWIEGGDQEEPSDEFLFRPKFFEEVEEEEPTEQSGRRRRRRGRGRDRASNDTANGEAIAVQVEGGGDDMELNVVFRRRK